MTHTDEPPRNAGAGTGADTGTGAGEARDAITDRYSGLARIVLAGERPVDCDPEAFADGCFGAAAYPHDARDVPEAALRASFGCGNPVAVADLAEGQTVLDLGSGGGLDVLLAARRVGPGGRVYGLDASADMLDLARANAEAAGVTNVEFRHGRIEDIPLPDCQVDVVISNCVINLSADKPRVLAEAFRVLRPGGRLGVADVIADDDLDPEQRAAAEQRVGCTSGTLTGDEYRSHLLAAGFTTAAISSTHAASGLASAIVHATRPAAPPGTLIRPMHAGDAGHVLAIYQDGLDTGDASFETTAPTWERWDAGHLPGHRQVAVADTGQVLGWVALTPVSDRCVYAGVAEESIYVHAEARGRGVGAALLQAVVESSETAGIWTVQTGIFPENTHSLALHARAGFRVVGTRERIGQHHGRWRDVVFLERRSPVTGT
jgi:L-amino acid N-acyltransferase YncA/precorrin-6B methylase 2